MTQTYCFKLSDGNTIGITLPWKYVPYYEELKEWVLENWDSELSNQENLRRFLEAAEYFVRTGNKSKHPVAWVLDKVNEHLDSPD